MSHSVAIPNINGNTILEFNGKDSIRPFLEIIADIERIFI
jgi:hypothetical protein